MRTSDPWWVSFCVRAARDSFKDLHSLHLPSERFSPVRRASDGLQGVQKHQAHLEKLYNQTIAGGNPASLGIRDSFHSSLKSLQQEHQELQVGAVGRE